MYAPNGNYGWIPVFKIRIWLHKPKTATNTETDI